LLDSWLTLTVVGVSVCNGGAKICDGLRPAVLGEEGAGASSSSFGRSQPFQLVELVLREVVDLLRHLFRSPITNVL
jgi:hypothetical protein